MADAVKSAHYNAQLDRALVRGSWADSNPASAPNGTALPWAELVRKWEKHTGGAAGPLATHTRNLLLYLIPATPDLAPSLTPLPSAVPLHPHTSRLHLHTHHPIPAGFIPATNITDRELDGDDTSSNGRLVGLDGKGWASLRVGEDRAREVEQGLKEVRELLQGGKCKTPGEKNSATLLLAMHLLTLGGYAECIETSQSVDWSPKPNESESAIVERVRGKVVQGIASELLDPISPSVLSSYTAAIQYLDSIPSLSQPSFSSNPSPTTPQSASFPSSSSSNSAFTSHRELWRWAEHALYRGSLLSARISLPEALRWLRTYSTYESLWPPFFRPIRRSKITALYLRALSHSHGSPQSSSSPLELVGGQSNRAGRGEGQQAGMAWHVEAERSMRSAWAMMEGSGRAFPKAGERRDEVEEFVVSCVALWEKGGQKKGSELDLVIKILWWATTQTFNSQPILRHLTRLLLASSSPSDARRTFELYTQLVDKARETAAADGADGDEGKVENLEMDDDRTYVEMLVFGARLVGRDCRDPKEGLRWAIKAKETLQKSSRRDLREGEELRARIDGVLGVLKMALIAKDHDPITRPILQSEALANLTNATLLSPSSSTAFYNLAYAQAECREIDASIVSTRSALELDPASLHGWHLLTLLLTAQGKWQDALKIADIGLESFDEDGRGEEAMVKEGVEGLPISPADQKTSGDGSYPTTSLNSLASQTHFAAPLITSDRLPHPNTLLPINPALLPTKADRLEAAIQLRMTQAAIVERLEGPEVALACQQEIFAFFSARCSSGKIGMNGGGGTQSVPVGQTGSSSSAPMRVDFGGADGDLDRPLNGGSERMDGTGLSRSGTVKTNGSIDDVRETQQLQRTVDAPATATNSSIQPPIVTIQQHADLSSTAPSPSISGSHSPSASSSNNSTYDASPRQSLGGGQPKQRLFLPKHMGGKNGNASGISRSASLSKLHLPRGGTSALGVGDPSSQEARNRTVSNASSIHTRSRRSSPSGGSSSQPLPPAPSSPLAPQSSELPSSATAGGVRRSKRETRMLSDLWLMSAATFRRTSKFEQALVAIQEAELLDPENPEVWVQLGLYYDTTHSPTLAISSLLKSLVFDPSHIPAVVHLSRLYTIHPPASNLALAHGLLNSLTQEQGWDCSEAWYFLAKVCEVQGGRAERVRECLEFAGRLERARTVRGVGKACERWI